MDAQFCPGAKTLRQPTPEILSCPHCGNEVEIWSDEIKARCSACGKAVMKDGNMSCLEWCSMGKECVGEDAYNTYMQNRGETIRARLMKVLEEHAGGDSDALRRAAEVVGWAEKLLVREGGEWHVVLAAAILGQLSTGSGADQEYLRRILTDVGMNPDDAQRAIVLAVGDPDCVPDTPSADVLADALALSGGSKHPTVRTATARELIHNPNRR